MNISEWINKQINIITIHVRCRLIVMVMDRGESMSWWELCKIVLSRYDRNQYWDKLKILNFDANKVIQIIFIGYKKFSSRIQRKIQSKAAIGFQRPTINEFSYSQWIHNNKNWIKHLFIPLKYEWKIPDKCWPSKTY